MYRYVVLLICVLGGPLLHGQDTLVQSMEYFIDHDPGYGNAEVIGVTANTNVAIDGLSIASGAYSVGFHQLFVRARDEHGKWGIPDQRLIHIDVSGAVLEVEEMEYFFDHDPGIGQGNMISGFMAGSAVELMDQSINTSSLTKGFHSFFLRAKASGGSWGLIEERLVFVNEAEVTLTLIDSLEYYFDVDPGYGFGTILDSFTPGNTVFIQEEILNTSVLSEGFHTLYIRGKAEGGVWGMTEQRLVYVNPSDIQATLIDSLEYFFDVDPGVGQGLVIDDFTSHSSISLDSETLVSSGLSTGFHTLFLRAKAEGGVWGMVEERLVFVNATDISATLVDSIEYYFDHDPGYGKASIISGFAADSDLNLDNELLLTSGLDPGFHTLYIRAKGVGGAWGMEDQRLVFVDEQSLLGIDSIEYYFDVDHGAGKGISIPVSDISGTLNLEDELLNTSALSKGFHQLFIRAKTEAGHWGIAEQRPIYINEAGNAVNRITEIEYFFDVDPGFGLGSSITPSEVIDRVELKRVINSAVLQEGVHTLFVRAKNEKGEWGSTDQVSFSVFGPGRALDSVALITAYQHLGGDSWQNNSNWLTTTIDTWFGVSMSEGRVDSLILSENNLSGQVPRELGFLTAIRHLDLSENLLTDSIPDTFQELPMLNRLVLNENKLYHLPDLSGLTNLTSANLDSNLFDFGDIEPLANVPLLTYSNQKIKGDLPIDSVIGIGQLLSISKSIEGQNNRYQWFLNEKPLSDAISSTFTLEKFSSADTGVYFLEIVNDILPDTKLKTSNYRYAISGLEQDSLALSKLYDSTGGPNWLDAASWLSSNLVEWEGVTINNDRVTALDLSNKGMEGVIPSDLSFADSLETIDFSGNLIHGIVPEEVASIKSLLSLDLSNNVISGLPDFKQAGNVSTLNVSNNQLQFGELERNIDIEVFTYSPQANISVSTDTTVGFNASFSLSFGVSGSENSYQWEKRGQPLPNAVSDEFLLDTVTLDDAGEYQLVVTNSLVPSLTLKSGIVGVNVSSLDLDSTALRALYLENGGDLWVPSVNWLNDPVAVWEGIEIDSSRVIAVDLNNRKVTGELSAEVTSMPGLQRLLLRGNEINALPNLAAMPRLNKVDVRENQLQFGDLERNLELDTLLYADQDKISPTLDTLLNSNADAIFTFEVSGSSNQYQWIKDDVSIEGGTDSQLEIQSIAFSDEGTYQLHISNNLLPDLVLSSGSINVRVSSLQRDSLVLIDLYHSTEGSSWSANVNWLNAPIAQWDSLSIMNNRVVVLSLSGSGLIGAISKNFLDITSLQNVDLSFNQIHAFPEVSAIENLTFLDVRGNRLQMDDLERNASVVEYHFNPQQPIENGPDTLLVKQGSRIIMSPEVRGDQNEYTWTLNNVTLDNSGSRAYTIDSINFQNMGRYQLEVRSPVMSSLDETFKLETQAQKILAVANIEFLPTFRYADNSIGVLAEGSSNLIEITETGPYDSIDEVDIEDDRIFFENIILGDYLLSARAAEGYVSIKELVSGIDTVEFIPTYFENQLEWDSAQVLRLRSDISDSLTMLRIPPPLDPELGDGTVELIVESDLPDDEDNNGRIEARRKVQKAGCSLRRNTSRTGGRNNDEEDEWELIAYAETDDNGEVNFGFLPNGLYRINIQYPGIPMDPTSFIEFEISEEEEEDGYVLSAIIFEDGIQIEVIEELGWVGSYFKDLSVYPNPADDFLTIAYSKLNTSQVGFKITDLKGSVQQSGKLLKGRNKQYEIDVSQLRNGIYFISFYDQSKHGTYLSSAKFVVKH